MKYIAKASKIAKLEDDHEQFLTLNEQAKELRQYNLGGLLKQYEPLSLAPLDPSFWEQLGRGYSMWSGQDYEQVSKEQFYNSSPVGQTSQNEVCGVSPLWGWVTSYPTLTGLPTSLLG
ncbi:hypothetical protein NHP200010_16240 [Helicobacter bizzozeronii]|uniref:hypothetical protein n=1 Tax=Helicobacter bizzozeronii TaxID=56877 RepID=UPI00244D8002|nr:hypothetical protein NHP200010_16240 [Helicobacter bizzozeronii]